MDNGNLQIGRELVNYLEKVNMIYLKESHLMIFVKVLQVIVISYALLLPQQNTLHLYHVYLIMIIVMNMVYNLYGLISMVYGNRSFQMNIFLLMVTNQLSLKQIKKNFGLSYQKKHMLKLMVVIGKLQVVILYML